jgi:CRP/FNR family transcriptional regulator/CRP/FNR family cyclic AMP-dependent transcriptional regulator
MLTLVEKVILLQDIDIFINTSTEDLSYIASITEEIEVVQDQTIYAEGNISDSMYVVIEGQVRLQRAGKEIMTAKSRDAFGSWALFDDEPRVTTATSLEKCHLLRLDKEDFYDLLADHSQITQGILKTFSTRLRKLLQNV